MAVGFITLFHKAPAPYHTSIPVVITFTVLLGGLWAIAMTKAIAVRRTPVSVGPQEIVGMEGVVRGGGFVFVRAELCRAEADAPLQEGQHVLVEGLDGLALRVRAV